ncbi:hypothetical protein SAMN05443144_1473 [Fodinibius roseus]|uniref:Uncharacterized protein n=2 Tax=Fodinibius roseus TaxID=1194090 RepID=A0A1M5LXW4_9BACT|nr:hypothetical protein SAMN05443144_1473 [Fodinibius roseus]
MSYFIIYTIGFFDGDESLYTFLDDNLISLRNSRCYSGAFLFFQTKLEKRKAQIFLTANDYEVINERNNKLNIIFSDPYEENKLNLFFLNTDYLKEQVLGLIEMELDGNNNFSTIHVYLLNSDSNKNYYTHRKKYENSSLIGSPSSPIDMSNNDIQPF